MNKNRQLSTKQEKNNCVEVLISAMHQKDLGIVDSTGIKSDVLIINQTDNEGNLFEERPYGIVRCISTKERGLSKSRNMAIANAHGPYCLICDDDEELEEDYTQTITSAFQDNPKAGIICFQVKKQGKKYKTRKIRVGYLNALRVLSVQIAINVNKIKESGLRFDERFGSGTPLGSGEENIFLYDCLKKGIKIYYVPKCIGSVKQESSHWFKGYNQKFFINQGKKSKRLLGVFGGAIYCIYFSFTKYKKYKSCISWFNAIRFMGKGLISPLE